MAAGTAAPMGTAAPAMTMNPTTTEHDFRFPRRPDARLNIHAHGQNQYRRPVVGNASLDQTQIDINRTRAAANNSLLGHDALFPALQHAHDSEQSIEQMQDDDPLATQVWKFFAKDEATSAEPGAHGKPDLADDGDEIASAWLRWTTSVCDFEFIPLLF